jgi:hypothetical protein
MRRKAGAKAHLQDLRLPIAGASSTLGLADLISAGPDDTKQHGMLVTAREKRARSVRSSLDSMAKAGLVLLPGQSGDRDRYENFLLLNEVGRDAVGEVEEYSVPRQRDSIFVVPSGLITNGWLHVLEDSEIALLLMVACRQGGWLEEGLVVMPTEIRLRHYGIHRDPFSSARKTLEWFGLLDVKEIGRHDDGRAVDEIYRVTRLGIIDAGFDEPGPQRAIQAIREQLKRSEMFNA